MIPSEDKIRRALLIELYDCKGHAATPKFCYDKLVEYFETDLEDDDFAPCYHSRSRWANTIQVTRNHMIVDGLILSTRQNKRVYDNFDNSQEGCKENGWCMGVIRAIFARKLWKTRQITLRNK